MQTQGSATSITYPTLHLFEGPKGHQYPNHLTIVMRNSITIALFVCLLGLNGCDESKNTPQTPGSSQSVSFEENDTQFVLTNKNFRIEVTKGAFNYGFKKSNGEVIVEPHPDSGLRISSANDNELFDVESTRFKSFEGSTLNLKVTTETGDQAHVSIEMFDSHAKFTVIPAAYTESNDTDSYFIFDFRTASVSPVYGMGDYGSHADEFNDVCAPCNNNVSARDTANLLGLVRDEVINQGSCRRFISNFAIFPSRGFAQVLFDDAKKRIGFTKDENRIGVADVKKVDTLYYFIGDMERIYADYKKVRELEGYHDVKPRFTMFNVGWEAYGALGWDTYQASVMENIQTYLDLGFPLKWGVVGSGFWPGDRRSRYEGTTVSFGMWDTTATPRQDNLANPRYPDPQALKDLFKENEMALLLGLRNHFKDPEGEAFNEENDGRFPLEVYEKGFLLRDRDGKLLRSEINQFPREPIYFLDSFNDKALAWFLEQVALWEADGFKEDAMIYDRMYQDAMWNPFNKNLADNGYLVMVRNAAYSVPGDLIRINDSYAGTGENYHSDPHRIPLNMLNNAASGAANGYPDIIGGTPTTSTTTHTFRQYYVRNAMLAAVSAGMSFGRGPWLLEHPEYEAIVLKAAQWHDRYAPYIYSAAIDSYNTGYPHTMTPLHIAFPDDENTYDLISREQQRYQWMLGPSMLATPLFGNDFETASSRDIYLPEGVWIDYESGQRFEGPTVLEDFPMPEERIPVFIGGKGVIVRKSQTESNTIEALVFPISTGYSEYTYTYIDGETRSNIVNNNTGWNPDTLVINESGNDNPVPFRHDARTGAFAFTLEPGRDYEISYGN